MSDKKFANMHYPGMRADPNEGEQQLDPKCREFLNEQIRCIGEDAQRRLLTSSVFVIGPTPLGVRVAKKLLSAGLGRVGLFGQSELTSAHDLMLAEGEEKTTALKALSKWAKTTVPWAQCESFSSESIDRQLDDMVRGFDLVVSAGEESVARQALATARELGKTVVCASVMGGEGWILSARSGALCQDCAKFPSAEQAHGASHAVLDLVAARVAAMVCDGILGDGFGCSLETVGLPGRFESVALSCGH